VLTSWGEEFGRHRPDAGWQWIVDPIDGTAQFVAGIKLPTFNRRRVAILLLLIQEFVDLYSSSREAKRRSNPGAPTEGLNCFAEPVIGPAEDRTRWLAMTGERDRSRSMKAGIT